MAVKLLQRDMRRVWRSVWRTGGMGGFRRGGARFASDAKTAGGACKGEGDSFRIVAPTAILGYGFPERSYLRALADTSAPRVDLVAVDAGSIDPGPYYLATRSSFTALEHVVRDLRVMIRGYLGLHRATQVGTHCPKLVVGSAGGCGTDNQVDIMAHEVRRLLIEEGGTELSSRITVAVVTSELRRDRKNRNLLSPERALFPLGPQPGGVDRGRADLDDPDTVVVAQMGLDPIMCALDHADIVICGRAYDPAVFAAEPVRRGYPAAPALHAAKVLECGAIATVPGSGSDCLVADLFRDGTTRFWAPNESRKATPLSVAAHTLYEKSHPHLFGMPGGYLNTTQTTFSAVDLMYDTGSSTSGEGASTLHAVECVGTTMSCTPSTVKLEGARVRGHRAVRLVLEGTNEVPAALDPSSSISSSSSSSTSIPSSPSSPSPSPPLPSPFSSPPYSSSSFVYGEDGVEARHVHTESGERELGILVSVRRKKDRDNNAPGEDDISKGYLALLRATLLHYGFVGRKATAGNLAFPFSPSDLTCVRKYDNEYITVCGTRDPGFIANHKHILSEVESYVASLSPHSEELEVRFVACGLEGQPRLRVEESVARTFEEAVVALGDTTTACEDDDVDCDNISINSTWVCDGGMAADFNVHHLVEMDDTLLGEMFQIHLLRHAEDGTARLPESIVPTLRHWGKDTSGDVVSVEQATATWHESIKPLGTTRVGKPLCDLATVVRSKNAGINEITFDLIFADDVAYEAAKMSPLLDKTCVEELLSRPVIGVYCDDTCLAIKITCDREINAGSAGDRDVYGAQQHSRLVRHVV